MKSIADTAAMYKNAGTILKASLPCAAPYPSRPVTVRALPSAIKHHSVHSVSITTSLTLGLLPTHSCTASISIGNNVSMRLLLI